MKRILPIMGLAMLFAGFMGPTQVSKADTANVKVTKPPIVSDISSIEPVETISMPQVQQIPTIQPEPVKTAPVTSQAVSGDKTSIMAAAGISPSDYHAVDYIISHESGWRHLVKNNEGSGAYGLCQALPGSKMASAGSDWSTNPVTQLKWCSSYAESRYGGWVAAMNSWKAKKWW